MPSDNELHLPHAGCPEPECRGCSCFSHPPCNHCVDHMVVIPENFLTEEDADRFAAKYNEHMRED